MYMLSVIAATVYGQIKDGSAVTTNSALADITQQVVKVWDVSNTLTAPLGDHWGQNYQTQTTWTSQHLGQVFGTALNTNSASPDYQKIYVATTQIYGAKTAAASYTAYTACNPFVDYNTTTAALNNVPLIWKLDASTGIYSPLVVSKTSAALADATHNQMFNRGTSIGNICFDKDHNQLFATDMEDGKIYRIDAATGNILSRYDPFGQFVDGGATTPVFAKNGEKLWGIAYGNSKVYFAVWNQDYSRTLLNGGPTYNEIYEVDIDPITGDFIFFGSVAGSLDYWQQNLSPVITLPHLEAVDGTLQTFSDPVADIELSANGREMLIAERTMNGFEARNTGIIDQWAHRSRAFRYEFDPATDIWKKKNRYYVGDFSWEPTSGVHFRNSNSAGGIDFGYSYVDANHNKDQCESKVWVTGDALERSPYGVYNYNGGTNLSEDIYGFAGIDIAGNDSFHGTPHPVQINSIYQDIFNPTGPNGSTPGNKDLIGDIDVFRINCSCSESADPNYLRLEYNYTGNVVLDGKYYVDHMVTFSGGVIDITNVDLVFSGCNAGLILTNGATLRANNSVFRPCNMFSVWSGIDLSAAATTNMVNSCVIKNADVALKLAGTAQAKVTSTEFYNCYTGVVIVLATTPYTLPISSNTFVTDAQLPDYTQCAVHGNVATYAIMLEGVDMQGNISQNTFVNNSLLNATPSVGVFMSLNADANISDNNFTDMYHAIEMESCTSGKSSLIQHNDIESYNSGTTVHSQILVSNSSSVNVLSNTIKNNMSTDGNGGDRAISLEGSNTIEADQNYVSGFTFGIYASAANNIQVQDNTIEHTGLGLVETNSANSYLSCNSITDQLVGIEIQNHDRSALTINSNCINNSVFTAIALTTTTASASATAFTIRNNFLFNYNTGIQNDNYTNLNLGVFASSIPGMNTFWSNTNATDVVAGSGVINVFQNYNLNTTSGVVNKLGNLKDQVYSTASCGHQVLTLPGSAPMEHNYTADLSCTPLTFGRHINPTGSISYYLQYKENMQQNPAKADAAIAAANADETMSAYDKAQFNYYVHMLTSNWTAAATDLQAFDTRTDRERCLKLASQIGLRLASGTGTIESITSGELQALRYYADQPFNYANYARQYLIARKETGLLYVPQAPSFKMDPATARVNDMTKDQVQVYPNPASGELNVFYAVNEDITGNINIKVYDILGNLVLDQLTDISAGYRTLDISSLAPGSYLVSLQSEGKKLAEGVKFVKVKY